MAKILIIEDDVGVLTALTKVLEKNGHTVITAQDGLQGTTLVHSEKPDLVILDLILPVGGGLTALRNLRISTHTKSLPVIVMSATDNVTLIEDVHAIGVDEYIEKPYDVNKLLARIQELLT